MIRDWKLRLAVKAAPTCKAQSRGSEKRRWRVPPQPSEEDADQASRVGKSPLNVRRFFGQHSMTRVHDSHVLCASAETQLAQPGGVQWLRCFWPVGSCWNLLRMAHWICAIHFFQARGEGRIVPAPSGSAAGETGACFVRAK